MTDHFAELLQVKEEDIHDAKSASDRLRILLLYAVRAPSIHNTQPWLFRIDGNTIELYADRKRLLPIADPDGRELFISCAAALFYLRTATGNFGYENTVELLPESRNPDLLARLHLGARRTPTDSDVALFRALTIRHTNRGDFEPKPLPYAVLSIIKAAANQEGAHLHLVSGKTKRKKVTDLIWQGECVQASNKLFRKELAAHIHPNTSTSLDGIPGYAVGIGNLASYVGPWMIRHLDWGRTRAKRDHKILMNSPVLAVLSTTKDNRAAWLAAGMALARCLLIASTKGVCASFFNAPIELVNLRMQLSEALNRRDYPQILLRLGYGHEVQPTPRRSIEDVIIG